LADAETVKKDIERLAELTGGIIGALSISGGEPLLHPHLPEIMEYARKCFPGQKLRLITNGILLADASEKFWTACRDSDAEISFTCYPIKIDIVKIKKIAESYHVRLIYQDDTDIREKTMYFSPLDPSGSQDAKKNYRLCFMANYTFVLERGKIYTCPTIAHIEHFNRHFKQNFAVSEQDYIDIYETGSIGEISRFMRKPMLFCRYCNKERHISGVKWAASQSKIAEWT
jgi:MoaA/NifB/PqqE/SkfB family radical SAM enzyme